uniref:G_PROTEIN_RECEP_F1_2 domain-containing protein n=1 Tax=Rhabditophanes sp. KR3021 TaxID=114890 RepID=A0AC35UBW7_9BILA
MFLQNSARIAMLILIVERICATVNRVKYEYESGYFFILCGTLFSFLFSIIVWAAWYYRFISNFCYSLIPVLIESPDLILYYAILVQNKNLRQHHDKETNLSEKYLIRQNIESLRKSMPLMATYILSQLVTSVPMVCVTLRWTEHQDFRIYLLFVYITRDIFNSAGLIFFLTDKFHLFKQQHLFTLSGIKKSNSVKPTSDLPSPKTTHLDPIVVAEEQLRQNANQIYQSTTYAQWHKKTQFESIKGTKIKFSNNNLIIKFFIAIIAVFVVVTQAADLDSINRVTLSSPFLGSHANNPTKDDAANCG